MNSLEITAHTSFSNPGCISEVAQVCVCMGVFPQEPEPSVTHSFLSGQTLHCMVYIYQSQLHYQCHIAFRKSTIA